jgi:hypothetical protein
MGILLSASRFQSGAAFTLTLACCEFEECQPPLERQSACQRLRLTNTTCKLLAEWEIRRFKKAFVRSNETQICQSVGTPSIGLDEAGKSGPLSQGSRASNARLVGAKRF